jgi:anti-anti-sigma factor
MAFEANIHNTDGLTVMVMHGDIDGAADELLNAGYATAIEGGAMRVLLDLTDVSYINSTGIALLVGLLAEARGSGRTLLVCGLTDHYKEIFEITRIADFVTIVDDEQAALAAT